MQAVQHSCGLHRLCVIAVYADWRHLRFHRNLGGLTIRVERDGEVLAGMDRPLDNPDCTETRIPRENATHCR